MAVSGTAPTANVWSQLTDRKSSTLAKVDSRPDAHLYFVGSRSGGKSTLLNKYIFPERTETPKPTEGLEYTYLRKPAANPTDPKDLAHLWELSGSDDLAHSIWNAVHILGPDQIATAAVAVVVDLSVPSQALQQAATWLQMIQAKVQASCAWLSEHGSSLPEQLAQRAKRYLGSSHEDRNVIQHIGISVVLVAAKDDAFGDATMEARSTMAQALRYVAHMYGASLVYMGDLNAASGSHRRDSAQTRACLGNFRAMLSHMLFIGLDKRILAERHSSITVSLCRKLRLSSQTDPLKSLMIPFGSDRLADIGLPRGMAPVQLGSQAGLEQWLTACAKVFPGYPQPVKLQSVLDLEQYAEPEVDMARKQIEANLAALHKQASRPNPLQATSKRGLRRTTGSQVT